MFEPGFFTVGVHDRTGELEVRTRAVMRRARETSRRASADVNSGGKNIGATSTSSYSYHT